MATIPAWNILYFLLYVHIYFVSFQSIVAEIGEFLAETIFLSQSYKNGL